MVYDYKKGAKTSLKEFMLRQFRETWEVQKQEETLNKVKIHKLLQRVERLEKESWDKEGAVEDLGGGG